MVNFYFPTERFGLGDIANLSVGGYSDELGSRP